MDTAPTLSSPFGRQVTDALQDMTGPDAAESITRLHDAEMTAVTARLTAAQDEAGHATADAMQKNYLLAGVLETAARETLRAGQQYARAQMAGRILKKIGVLADQSDDGTMAVADVRALLDEPLPPVPFQPTMLAFHPSAQYQGGHFATDDNVTHQVFAFTGWSMMLESPGRAPVLRPAFLVDHEVKADSVLLAERGLKLQYMK